MKVATAVHAWEITDHREVNGQTWNTVCLPAVTGAGYSWWNGKCDEISVSLEGWDVKEEEEQKILLSIKQKSLKPVREKHSGVWGR